jgi:hypothetical protein
MEGRDLNGSPMLGTVVEANLLVETMFERRTPSPLCYGRQQRIVIGKR